MLNNLNNILDSNFFFFKNKVLYFGIFSIFIAFLELVGVGMVLPILDLIFSDQKNFKLVFLQNKLGNYYSIEFFIFFVIAFFLTKYFIQIIYYQKLNKFLFQARQDLVEKILKNFLNKNFNFFAGKNKTDFIHTCIEDINNYTIFFLKPVIIFFSEFIVICLIVFFLFFINTQVISFIVLYFAIVFLIYIKAIKKPLNYYGSVRRKTEKKRLLNLKEIFNAIKEIKIYKFEKALIEKFSKDNMENLYVNYKYNLFSDFSKIYFEFFVLILLFVSLFVAKILDLIVISNFSILGTIAYASLKMLPSLNKLSVSYQMISFGKSTVSIIKENINLKNIELNNQNLSFDHKKINKISFKNVSFNYDNHEKIFDDLNLVINPEEKIGILGASGTGKSTFIEMIMKINKPTSGFIEINDKDIKDFNFSSKSIGYAPQEFIFFNDTIENNVLIGRKKRTNHNQYLAQIFSMLNLNHLSPNQLIYDNEENLSGGEKQRVGLARVLYEEPEFLLMDETTSSVDEDTEHKIFKTLNSLRQKLGFICISHNKQLLLKFCEKTYTIQNKKLVLIK